MKGWIFIPTEATQNNNPSWSIAIKATNLTTPEYWQCAECGYRIRYTTEELPACPSCKMRKNRN